MTTTPSGAAEPEHRIGPTPPPRVDSVDMLRGLVMVLMVLDHTRDYFSDVTIDPTDLDRATPALFLTRWVTHFCAPVFAFLAGTGAYLAGTRGISRGALGRFLLTRGLWLMFLEQTVEPFGMIFRPTIGLFLGLVLWSIGWSLVVLAGLVALKAPSRVIAALGVLLIVGHNLADGQLETCLHSFKPSPGDCLFLRAGTIHAVGGGVVMAEIQQNSDVTFRLYDWNRPGPDGKPRQLHIEQSLESIDWSAGPVAPVVGQPLPGLPEGLTGERLVRCDPFILDRYRLTGQSDVIEQGRMSIWLVTDGSADLIATEGPYRRSFKRGEAVLVPASADPLEWAPTGDVPHATLLCATLP